MAEKDKKFYWLKLKSEFMNGEVVDFLMSQKNGANYVVLYQMLALKTMQTQGKLCSEMGEVIIPYDPEKIQRDCKWFDIDTVRVAMELYAKLGLVYRTEEGLLQIANYEELVGSETYWANRKRIERQEMKQIGQCPTNVQDNVQKTLISNSLSNSNSIILNNNKEDINSVIESIENEDLKNEIREFIKMRNKIKKSLTPHALNLILKELNKITPNIDEQVLIVQQSIKNGWQGVFPLKEDKKQDSFEKFKELAKNYNYEE